MLIEIGLIWLIIAIVLLLHHLYKHWDGNEPENVLAHRESCCGVCFFQLSDVSNHETWVIMCLSQAVTCLVLGNSGKCMI